jgi:hypothetical protein
MLGGTLVGIVMLAVASTGAGAEHELDGQVGWLNLAVVALVVSASAQATFLTAGRRSVSRLRRAVTDRPQWTPESSLREPGAVPMIVTVRGTSWHHRDDCALVAGKDTSPVNEVAETESCPVCRAGRVTDA